MPWQVPLEAVSVSVSASEVVDAILDAAAIGCIRLSAAEEPKKLQHWLEPPSKAGKRLAALDEGAPLAGAA